MRVSLRASNPAAAAPATRLTVQLQQLAPAAAATRLQPAPRAAGLVCAAVVGPRRASIVAAAGAAAVAAAGSESCGYQRPLTNQERKAKRAESQRLGSNLCTVNLGQKGLTPAFLDGFRTALTGNELVKVRVGGCNESPEDVAEVLVAAGDCLLVHKIGFTLTFYRKKGLPPAPPAKSLLTPQPTATATSAAVDAGSEGMSADDADDDEEGEEDSDDSEGSGKELDEEATYLMEIEDAYSDSDSNGEEEEEQNSRPNSSKWQAAAAKAAKAKRTPPPPEFTIIS